MNFAVYVSRSAADGLDQRSGRTKETFLIGIEYCDKGNLWKIQAFSQQVDAYQNIEETLSVYPADRLNSPICIHVAGDGEISIQFNSTDNRLEEERTGDRNRRTVFHRSPFLETDRDLVPPSGFRHA